MKLASRRGLDPNFIGPPTAPSKQRRPAYFQKPQSSNVNEAERKCLFCQKPFISEWSGNRLCTRCKNLSEFKNSP